MPNVLQDLRRWWWLLGIIPVLLLWNAWDQGYLWAKSGTLAARDCVPFYGSRSNIPRRTARLPIPPSSTLIRMSPWDGCMWYSEASISTLQAFYEREMRRWGWFSSEFGDAYWQHPTHDPLYPQALVCLRIEPGSLTRTQITVNSSGIYH